MPLRPEQLATALSRGLAPVYLIAGDEPVRVADACAQVRTAARAAGFDARELHTLDAGFDWTALAMNLGTAGLFAQRRVLELDVGEGRIGAAGEKVIGAWLDRPDPDTVLLIRGGGFDRAARDARWAAHCERAGVYVYLWPLEAAALPGWVQARARSRGLRLNDQAAALLAQWAQGNLAVAAQAIERLALDTPAGTVLDAAAVRETADDGARFDVRDLLEATLSGRAAAAAGMLGRLRAEGVEAPLVVWSLAQAARALAGGSVPPGNRVAQAAGQQALRRAPAGHWRRALARAARADRLAKGAAVGSAWLALTDLVLHMAGTSPVLAEA